MKFVTIGKIGLWLMLVLCVALWGCRVPVTLSPTNQGMPVPTVTSYATAVKHTPTQLLTNTPTPSPIPPTRTPRPTPAPTMAPDEEYAFVSKMLRDNGGCRLPCWWGLMPGVTTWESTRTFFASLGKIIHSGDILFPTYTVYFDTPSHFTSDQVYFIKNGMLDKIDIYALPPTVDHEYVYGDRQFVKDWEAHLLPQLLSIYGIPSEVWLYVGAADAPWAPFDLVLFYPEQGILVRYEAPAIWGDKVFRLCQYQMKIEMWLWSPQYSPERSQWSYWENDLGDLSRFRPLETATGMSLTEFVQKMGQPDEQVCLETPQDLWYEGAP